jgi:hypothetical protein
VDTFFRGEAVALRGRLDRCSGRTALVVNEIAPRETNCRLDDLASRDDDEIVAVRGVVVEEKAVYTRAGDPLVFAKLRDGDTCVDVLIFAGADGARRPLVMLHCVRASCCAVSLGKRDPM